MIFNLIGLCMILYSLINYKKAFYAYMVYKIVLVQNISLIAIPGIPLLTLDMALALWFSALYVISGVKYKAAKVTLPYLKPMLILCGSWLLSSIFSVAGLGSEISRLIQTILTSVFVPYLCWELIETENDFKLLFKWITIVIFFTCIYGLVESAIQQNPLQQYEATLIRDTERTIDYSYSVTARGYRISSVFSHAIGAGMTWALYMVVVLAAKVRRSVKFCNQLLVYITTALCAVCILLTKMRGPLVFLFIGMLAIVDFKKKRFYKIVLIGALLVLISLPFISEHLNVFKALFDKTAAESIRGSSLEQRAMQFAAAGQLVQGARVIWGLGAKFQSVLSGELVNSLLGLESIWLADFVKYGIVGIVAEAVLLIFSIIIIPKYYRSRELLFISLSYWIVASLSSTPGFNIHLYYIALFFFIKYSKEYIKGTNKRVEREVSPWKTGVRIKIH